MEKKPKARNPPPALDSSDLPVRLFLLSESVPLGTFSDEWGYEILRERPTRRYVSLEGQVSFFGK